MWGVAVGESRKGYRPQVVLNEDPFVCFWTFGRPKRHAIPAAL